MRQYWNPDPQGKAAMGKPKKILNDPRNVVDEALDGMVLASDGRLVRLKGLNAILRADIPPSKVGLLIGGGSGHEPMFTCFVGENLADGSAAGQVFAAPSPDIILAVTKAIHRGRGVLYVYGNYAGDIMNFDIAAELAADEGIEVRTVRVWDDVAAAPPDRIEERRGIAGDFYVVKIAGGAAAECDRLDEVYRIAAKARDNTRSMGVAVAAGSIPETGARTFELGEDEIEIGMGAHGEPGVSRQKLATADAVADPMTAAILQDLPFQAGDEVALLINNLGATTMMELLIVNRRVRAVLADSGVKVYTTDMGRFLTCQEMAGFSISLLRLDAELKRYLDLPVCLIGYSRVQGD
jgi:phosphoenolpyruvate---glycerone phosphotransferase subunit DhaK